MHLRSTECEMGNMFSCLSKSLLAECPYVAMNGASFNLLLSDSILSCLLMIWLQLFISLTSATHLAQRLSC